MPVNGRLMFLKVAGIFKSALFPRKCMACGVLFYLPETGTCTFESLDFNSDLRQVFNSVMAPFFCRACISQFSPVESPICSICGFMYTSREGEDHICGKCLSGKKHYRTARSAGIHDNVLMTAIHHFKYKKKIQLAFPLSIVLMTALFNHYNLYDVDLIIPVPLHKKRFRHRGFNQAYLLIKHWQSLPPHIMHRFSGLTVNRTVLVRHRHTPPQAQLDREQRKINLKNAFDITHPHDIEGKYILLIDDVFTTGATVDECAKVLLKNGARQIDVLTLARAVTGQPQAGQAAWYQNINGQPAGHLTDKNEF